MNNCNTIFQGGKFITYLLAPEQDSLDLKNANKYVNEFYTKLLTLCTQEPTIQLLGKSSDYEDTRSCDSNFIYPISQVALNALRIGKESDEKYFIDYRCEKFRLVAGKIKEK